MVKFSIYLNRHVFVMKLRTNRKHKETYELDKDLLSHFNKQAVSIFAKLKISNCELFTEEGRPYYHKTCLCNFDPLKPHFYIVKLGFTGV